MFANLKFFGVISSPFFQVYTPVYDTSDRHHCRRSMCISTSTCMKESKSIFTARCYASAVLAMALCPSVCPSICPSVTSRCSTKTAKRRITQTTPHDSPGTLVFWCQRSPRNSTGVTPYEGRRMQVGWVKLGDFWPIAGYISKTVQDRHIVSIKVE